MKRAHQIRVYEAYQLQGLSYHNQMSICLKRAYKEIALVKENEKRKKIAQERLEQQKAEAIVRMNRVKEQMKNKKPRAEKVLSELDFAKAAYAADQRDKAAGLNVRYW